MRPTLSICIPTFQRAVWLRQALDAATEFLAANDAELCLSDNASTEPAKKELINALLRAPHPRIRVTQQRENVGLERNMVDAISMARGEYVLPMGDDDQIVPSELASVMSYLTAKRPSLVILDGWHCDAELRPTRRHLTARQRGLSLDDAREAFALFWDKMPPGSFIVNSTAYRDACWTRYVQTSHSYTGVVWDWLVSPSAQGQEIMSWDAPAVYLRQAEKSWKRDAGRIHYEEIPRWFDKLPPELDPARDHARDAYLTATTGVPMLLAMRGENQLDLEREIPRSAGLSLLKRGFVHVLMHIQPRHAAWLHNGLRHAVNAVRTARATVRPTTDTQERE